MLVKLINNDMINRKYQFRVGMNELEDFDSNPNIECAPGIYFCEAKRAVYWSRLLGYEYISDVEMPDDATVLKFRHKCRTNKIILSQPVPIEDHPIAFKIFHSV
jgi:hypothetical protein